MNKRSVELTKKMDGMAWISRLIINNKKIIQTSNRKKRFRKKNKTSYRVSLGKGWDK